MKVNFRKSFEKDLRQLQNLTLLQRAKTVIESVERAESLDALIDQGITDFKKLKGNDGYFRVRIGDYRIGLFMEGNTLWFVRILHRREFYRYFP